MKKNTSSSIYTGTSGLVLPVPNKKSFPEAFQDKSRLTYYSSLFNTIEVNSSFKKLPPQKTVKRWAQEVPADFRFTIKLSKWITHNKELTFNVQDVAKFMEAVNGAGTKAGCLLIQFPGKLTADHTGHLQKLLVSIKKYDPEKLWSLAVELRHETWYNEQTYKLLRKYKAAIVIHDMPPTNLPEIETGSNLIYLRFHGTEKNYRGSYPEIFLKNYANKIIQWKEEGKNIYVYFNNTLGAAMPNLLTLTNYLRAAVSKGPLLPGNSHIDK